MTTMPVDDPSRRRRVLELTGRAESNIPDTVKATFRAAYDRDRASILAAVEFLKGWHAGGHAGPVTLHVAGRTIDFDLVDGRPDAVKATWRDRPPGVVNDAGRVLQAEAPVIPSSGFVSSRQQLDAGRHAATIQRLREQIDALERSQPRS